MARSKRVCTFCHDLMMFHDKRGCIACESLTHQCRRYTMRRRSLRSERGSSIGYIMVAVAIAMQLLAVFLASESKAHSWKQMDYATTSYQAHKLVKTINKVFPDWLHHDARHVAYCESRLNKNAGMHDRTTEYKGPFQMGLGERKRWHGMGWRVIHQVRAAWRYARYSLRTEGYAWGPWIGCAP